MNKKYVTAFCNIAMLVCLMLLPYAIKASSLRNSITIENEMPDGVDDVVYDGNNAVARIKYTNGAIRLLKFYGPNIFRVFQDKGNSLSLRDPEAKPEAQILVADACRDAGKVEVESQERECFVINTSAVSIKINKADGCMKVQNRLTGQVVLDELLPAVIADGKTTLTFKEQEKEYFYGGGVQNGRFSHKGNIINIVNENSWTDGGVCSPATFYWSTAGYGFMAYTFSPGSYDFGSKGTGKVQLTHDSGYLDYFLMVNDEPIKLLNDYYQLTGHPVLLPKFGFYEGHLNAYNRDYWKETDKSGYGNVKFEDGKFYHEDQKDNGGVRESLNGELDGNYQFSARAVIDRYKKHDMPLGWVLPNDGYGAGYGQTSTLDGNIANLKSFGDYTRENGVEIGLWTQSDLHPIDTISALLQRDIVKEIRDAGVRVLKTDVAWVGAGYSFGLNGISDVATLMPQHGNNARPFIITLDGWSGTQRYAGVWSGDQTGGKWEYIRFHIPTFIGAGLGGQPNITSDMDGIFGGLNVPVNVREFQWKTFTPMQLNMDGWGSNEKYPHALGEPAASLNRAYLKMKSMLMPYTYSIAYEALAGKPMIRALMLDYPNPFTMGKATQYEYLYGDAFLVAPIYQETKSDAQGNDIRNNIYLPEGEWIDYFSGEKYVGGAVLNSFAAPIWKLPLFVKTGSIIPITKAHNNVREIDSSVRAYEVFPSESKKISSHFTEYDDDGATQEYLNGAFTSTNIDMTSGGSTIKFLLAPTKGNFDGFINQKSTIVRFVGVKNAKSVTALVDGKKIKIKAAKSAQEFETNQRACFIAPNSSAMAKSLPTAARNTSAAASKSSANAANSSGAALNASAVALNSSAVANNVSAIAPTDCSLASTKTDFTKFFSAPVVVNGHTVQMTSAEGLVVKLPKIDVSSKSVCIMLYGCDFDEGSSAMRAKASPTHGRGASTRTEAAPEISLNAPSGVGVKDADCKPYSLKISWNDVVGASAYEIMFNDMSYFDIRDNAYLFEDLMPEREYNFKVRACDVGKASEWVEITAKTSKDPYELAIKGITAQCTAPSQGGEGLRKLFDFDAATLWHTDYNVKAVPFEMIVDLHSVNTLSKMQYVPREVGRNGIITSGKVYISLDKDNWTDMGPFNWASDATTKDFTALDGNKARYIKICVDKAVGDFGSGASLYVFRKEGSPFFVPGDINNDGHIDDNDLTSYINYTGLRQGDSDFEGYVSKGDINGNGLIDAYDISNAAVEIGGSHSDLLQQDVPLSGEISVNTDKRSYKAGDEVVVTIAAKGLADVNAFSLALPYSEGQLRFESIEADMAKGLNNFSRDRLHTNGSKAYYVTFVGVGDAAPLNGDGVLCKLRFRAASSGAIELKERDVLIVDKRLHSRSFNSNK